MDSPNIVHFNCSTNDLHGIGDLDDFSCGSDEDNDFSDEDDSCSDCSVSAPLRKSCCCCCRQEAYGLASQSAAPQVPQAADWPEVELRRASAKCPAQVAMVVMRCARLHLGGPQSLLLPMGALVTALYGDRDWICVQTPHGVRGLVRRSSCAPLGALLAPPVRRAVSGRRSSGAVSAASSLDTLRRNLAHHRGRAADKLLEKNIDKLVWGSASHLPGMVALGTDVATRQ
ncbi:uncharacterized protein LOC144120613 isoform X2 [Amblyomma americanum]